MLKKTKTRKTMRKGGNWSGRAFGRNIKTFCCDTKSGIEGSIVGENCSPSMTGQCNIGLNETVGIGKSYKFRCFNNNMNEVNINKDKITEGGLDDCSYIRGTLGKAYNVIGTGLSSVIGSELNLANPNYHTIGGKQKKKTLRRMKKMIRKSHRRK